MSNFLFAMGRSERIEKLTSTIFSNHQIDEFTLEEMSDDLSILIIERRSQLVESSILELPDGKKSFFKGFFIDHDNETMTLGPKGFVEWYENNPESRNSEMDLEGAFVSATWSENELKFQTDIFRLFPLSWFCSEDIFVSSDSLFLLSEVRKALGLPCKLDREVLATRAWTHGLAAASMTSRTLIEEVFLLPAGAKVCVTISPLSAPHFSFEMSQRNLRTVFQLESTNYQECLRNAAIKIHRSLLSLDNLDNTILSLGLSGGLDSRVVLALSLDNINLKANLRLLTNLHSSRREDHVIANRIASRMGMKLNPDIAGSISDNSLEQIENPFGLWMLSNLGQFDMTYLVEKYWQKPYSIDIGGHGAEVAKGTFIWPLSQLTDRAPNKTRKKIEEILQNSLENLGIESTDFDSVQWLHLCYKSGLQNGRFVIRSAIFACPLLSTDLVAMSTSQEFREIAESSGSSLLHDLLIMVNPQLASIPFDKVNKNLTPYTVTRRSKELGKLYLEDYSPYAITGCSDEVLNGPPRTFLRLVERYDLGPSILRENGNSIEPLRQLLDEHWKSITDKEIRSILQPAYDMAKERMNSPEPYFPSVGAMVAKILAISMTTSN